MLSRNQRFILKHSLKEFFFGKHKASLKETEFTAFHECIVDYAYRLKAQVKVMNQMHGDIKKEFADDPRLKEQEVKQLTAVVDRIINSLGIQLNQKTNDLVSLDKQIKKGSVGKDKIAEELSEINKTLEFSTVTLRSLNKMKITGSQKLDLGKEFSALKSLQSKEDKLSEYIDKITEQTDQMLKAHKNFISIIQTKMNQDELTYSRFKITVDNISLAFTDQVDQFVALIETLKIMEDTHFLDPEVSGKHFDALDNMLQTNQKTIASLFDISLKIAQMKNKDAHVEFDSALSEMEYLQNNIKQYIDK